MVTVVVCPQDGASQQQRRYALPNCALSILEKLEQGGEAIDAAHRVGQGKLRLTVNICGKSSKLEVVSLID